jgi:hypothetical protein
MKAMFLDKVILFRLEIVRAQDLTGKVANALQLLRLAHGWPLVVSAE